MKRQFEDEKDVVTKLWNQFSFKDVEVEEIVDENNTLHILNRPHLMTTIGHGHGGDCEYATHLQNKFRGLRTCTELVGV